MDNEHILTIVKKHNKTPWGLLPMLQDIQLAIGYLPQDAIEIVAENTGRSIDDVYCFASSCNSFRFEPDLRRNARNLNVKKRDSIYKKCNYCGHSLMDYSCFVEGLPTIKITASSGMNHGWLRIPSFPDIDTYACEYQLPRMGIVNFFCPHCNAELVPAEKCGICEAPMIPVVDKIWFATRCSRHDCDSKSPIYRKKLC